MFFRAPDVDVQEFYAALAEARGMFPDVQGKKLSCWMVMDPADRIRMESHRERGIDLRILPQNEMIVDVRQTAHHTHSSMSEVGSWEGPTHHGGGHTVHFLKHRFLSKAY